MANPFGITSKKLGFGSGADDAASYLYDPLDVFGGRAGKKAAQEQQAAAAKATALAAAEGQNARDNLFASEGEAQNYLLEGANAAGNQLRDYGDAAQYYRDVGLRDQAAMLGSGYGAARGDLTGARATGVNDLASSYGQARGDLASLRGGGLAAGFTADPGYQFALQQGEDAIMRSAAARGGRMGGDTLKALQEHGQGLASQYFDKYAAREMGLAGQMSDLAAQYGQNQASLGAQYGTALAGLEQGRGQDLSQAYGQHRYGSAGAQEQLGSNLANLYNTLGQNQASTAMGAAGENIGLAGTMANAYSMPVQYAGQDQAAHANAKGKAAQTMFSMFGMSDRRVKTDIAPGGEAIDSLLDALSAQTFRYIDSSHGQGEVVGIMAQDAEKSAIGRYLVTETPEGKALDIRKALSAALAALAHEHGKRMDLEARVLRLESLSR